MYGFVERTTDTLIEKWIIVLVSKMPFLLAVTARVHNMGLESAIVYIWTMPISTLQTKRYGLCIKMIYNSSSESLG